MSDADLLAYFIVNDYIPFILDIATCPLNWYGASPMKHITFILEQLAEGKLGLIKAIIRTDVDDYFPEFDQLFN